MAWGGSEELWYRAARKLQHAGHQIAVNYKWWPTMPHPLQILQEAGASIELREQPPGFWQRKSHEVRQLLSPRGIPVGARRNDGREWLLRTRPDAVLITIGYHPDPLNVAGQCQELGIPYGINVQCASNAIFIHSERMKEFRDWYQGARRVFFVSRENQHKLETNMAARLENAEIVCNPFNVKVDQAPEWPSEENPVRLACVGRIHFQSKGQDLIVDVLRQDQWRERPIEVRFYGHDQGNRRQLEELIRLHGLEQKLILEGYLPDVPKIWATHHGLLLPSRYEGAALVVVEAMMCNRVAIVTDTGRNRELIDDGHSGFVARASTTEFLSDAMERAWEQLAQWREIGQRAGQHVRQRFLLDPVTDFAKRIAGLAP